MGFTALADADAHTYGILKSVLCTLMQRNVEVVAYSNQVLADLPPFSLKTYFLRSSQQVPQETRDYLFTWLSLARRRALSV